MLQYRYQQIIITTKELNVKLEFKVFQKSTKSRISILIGFNVASEWISICRRRLSTKKESTKTLMRTTTLSDIRRSGSARPSIGFHSRFDALLLLKGVNFTNPLVQLLYKWMPVKRSCSVAINKCRSLSVNCCWTTIWHYMVKENRWALSKHVYQTSFKINVSLAFTSNMKRLHLSTNLWYN